MSILLPILDGKLWGFIDPTGRVVVEPRFADVCQSEWRGPLYPVREGKKWGYVDVRGTLVVEPRFASAEPFSEDLAVVRIVKEGKELAGFIDLKGQMVLEPRFSHAIAFREGLAVVEEDGVEGHFYIDRTGKKLFEAGWPFSEGLAVGVRATAWPYLQGFRDREGNFVIEPVFAAARSFSEGLAEVHVPQSMTVQGLLEARVGYIDRTGHFAVEPKFAPVGDDGCPFSEGLARVCAERGGAIGFIDKRGQLPIDHRFHSAGDFSEGFAMAYPEGSPDEAGVIDRNGDFVIPPVFSIVGEFHHGACYVQPDPSRRTAFGYVDTRGKWLWQPSKPFHKRYRL